MKYIIEFEDEPFMYEDGMKFYKCVQVPYYSLSERIIKRLIPYRPERKKGKWVVTSEFEDCCYVKCNQCKVTQVFYYNKPLTNFCPCCGADMRGEQDDDK